MRNFKANYKQKTTFMLLIIILFCFLFSSCEKANEDNLKIHSDFLGSEVITLIRAENTFFWQKNKLEDCFFKVSKRLEEINDDFSVEKENSLIYEFNNLAFGESITVDKDFEFVFERAKDLYSETDGAFNPSVKNLVDLWGFSKKYDENNYVPTLPFDRVRNPDGSFDLPEQKFIQAFMKLCDFESISLIDGQLYKNCQSQIVDGVEYRQQIDLSAIVKGYASDEISRIILSCGFKDFYVSLGTSSMFLGEFNGNEWNVSVTDPKNPDGNSAIDIKVKNAFLSTSGTYQNSYYLDGAKYHHIINTKTGFPVETDILSLTISCEDGATSDALSTAYLFLGSERAKELLEKKSYNYCIITENEMHCSFEMVK